MKLATLNKIPANGLDTIRYVWRGVYVDKDIDRGEGFQFVAGVIAGLHYAEVITDWEDRELFNYYRRWFSL